MGALNALQRSPGALLRNPILIVPILIIGIFQVPQLILQATDPFLASIVSLGISAVFIFVMPFFQGGIIGMSDESLEGRTGLSTFIDDGKTFYVKMLVAYILLLVIGFVLFLVFFIISFIVSIAFLSQMEFSGLALGVFGLFFVLSFLPTLLFVFFIQFYGQAIVLDNESSLDGIKRSIGLVRRNLLSTVGYSIIGTVFGGGLGLVLGGISMLTSPRSAQVFDLPEIGLPTVAAVVILVVVVSSVVGAFLSIFSVAFYRDISTG